MDNLSFKHEPVLMTETLQLLAPRPGEIAVDCTLGGGGHTRAIWSEKHGVGRLIAIDQDLTAINHAKAHLPPEITVVHDNFRNLRSILLALEIPQVNRILFDLGVSSPQLDEAERGFSYQQDALLDMRMNPQSEITAAQLVNKLSEEELARIIWEFGEERWAKRIAKFVVDYRNQQGPITTTGQLVDIIKGAIPAGARRTGPHPAKRTFQALRIAVNDELEHLSSALEAAIEVLAPGGRIAVITFHSLEDRIVKNIFRQREKGCVCPPHLPVCVCEQEPTLKVITRKPVIPTKEEKERNPRSRSAKLRVAERC
ncbi:MAG: 16S rRNA (cytosine(1402)-N(4))-methyltransferase RsmH [Firmicutes bacterium]|nr:16S rRNA (cytosine(1402)-N(4))-methyltransferase RsmH [Bacillota bacterium]